MEKISPGYVLLRRVRAQLFLATAITYLALLPCAFAQTSLGTLDRVTRSSTLTFILKDDTCVRGMISKADANTISVEPFKQPFVQLQRDSLLQVSQGNALLYSTRSSWTDVANTHPYPREKFVIVLKDGKIMEGMPVKVDPDDIVIKRGFATRTVSKSKIATVDYLRWNPPTDGFSLAVEEAPYALFLYPELYSRAVGLEGRIPVRLYDASKPEDDRVSGIKACP